MLSFRKYRRIYALRCDPSQMRRGVNMPARTMAKYSAASFPVSAPYCLSSSSAIIELISKLLCGQCLGQSYDFTKIVSTDNGKYIVLAVVCCRHTYRQTTMCFSLAFRKASQLFPAHGWRLFSTACAMPELKEESLLAHSSVSHCSLVMLLFLINVQRRATRRMY